MEEEGGQGEGNGDTGDVEGASPLSSAEENTVKYVKLKLYKICKS